MADRLPPVSAALEAELRTQVARQGLVVWLDTYGEYTRFVDDLVARTRQDPGALPYGVCAFRGSHLELMLALEGRADGVEPPSLVVHLPGYTEQSVRETPLLEIYDAGKRFRKRLDTLVTDAAGGRVPPEELDAFLAGDGLTLEGADAWLAAHLDAVGGGLAKHLQALTPTALFDDLLGDGYVAGHLGSEDDRATLWRHLAAVTGLDAAWRDAYLPAGELRGLDVVSAGASWALSVEYVHDLARDPVEPRLAPMTGLPGPVVKACRQLAAHLRDHHPGFYRRTADETEGWLEAEVEAAQAVDLGKIDTFRFEEDKVLAAALTALDTGDWDQALAWAEARVDGGSFWLRDDEARRGSWGLVQDAARLGAALAAAGERLGADGDLKDALDRYVAAGAAADQAHRHLEQRRTAVLHPQLAEFETLRARLDGLRQRWRDWADRWARDFSERCRRVGFLPPAPLRQRSIFEASVRPLTQDGGITAVFLVDALRYEMAEELFRAMDATPSTSVALEARLAELPTVTEVGMNVLAPVTHHGRLRPALGDGRVLGFTTGEFRVSDPETRRRAMADRVGGATCPLLTLDEVFDRDARRLKQTVAKASLVVVHAAEIDQAGESGAGPATFETALRRLQSAWQLLREAGVTRFVLTADHGFLLLDDGAGAAVQGHGRKIDPHRRHVFSEVAADHDGEVRVALRDLDYVGVDGQLMFPDSLAVFDTGGRPPSFVHGGNSLQERVVPVLSVVHHRPSGGDSLEYQVTAEALEGVAGLQCLAGRVEVAAQGGLPFGGAREVEVALRVADAPDVTVEIAEVRDGARRVAGALKVEVGRRFEIFFRLAGPRPERVNVEVCHPGGGHVRPCTVDGRFDVAVVRGGADEAQRAPSAGERWLEGFEDKGVRAVFAHLGAHGSITEEEMASLLGSPRAVRRFARRFEEHAAKAPYRVRIASTDGRKRYVREGTDR